MTITNHKSGLIWLWLSLLLFAIDYLTKAIVLEKMFLGESIQLLPFFNFTYMHNYGAAFSFLSEAGGWQRYFLSSVAIIISILLIFWLRKLPANNLVLCGAYSMVLGGAVGNLVDRLQHGYVIDFLHFYYENWHYPAFNVADMAIVCGAGLLLLDAFTGNKVQEPQS